MKKLDVFYTDCVDGSVRVLDDGEVVSISTLNAVIKFISTRGNLDGFDIYNLLVDFRQDCIASKLRNR